MSRSREAPFVSGRSGSLRRVWLLRRLLPEHVTLDEWGYPVLNGEPVDAELVALATRAVNECPRRALRLVRRTARS